MKIMKAQFPLMIAFGSILFFHACKDKDPTKPGYQRKPPAPEFHRIRIGEAKNYLSAKPGSYWIYKNTLTNDLDTQTVTSFSFDSIITKGTLDYSRHITIEYDKITRSIYSSFNQWIYYDNSGNNTPNAEHFNNGRTIIDRVAVASISIPFFYPFNISDWSGTGSSNTTCKGVDSMLVIQGKVYYNVANWILILMGFGK